MSNFAKHADKDATRTALFSTEDTLNALYVASNDYITLINWIRLLGSKPFFKGLLTENFNSERTPTEKMSYILLDWMTERYTAVNDLLKAAILADHPRAETSTALIKAYNDPKSKQEYLAQIDNQNLWPSDLSQELSFSEKWIEGSLNLDIGAL